MYAVVITRPGGPEVLALKQVPEPAPSLGQVLVKVEAVGLNRADLLQRRGRYPAPPGYPSDILGLEYSGVVEALGPGASLRKPGDRVMGIVGGGSFAERIVVHERETIRLPAQLDFAQAAAIPEAFLTAYDALVLQSRLSSGEVVLIHAVGSGVGLAALQLARELGCHIIGTSRSEHKLTAAAALGLQDSILVTDDQFGHECLELTGGNGVDLVMDFVGGAYLAQNLNVLRPGGRMILLGLLGGSTGEVSLGLLLSRRLSIIGSTLRSRPLEEKIALARKFEAHIVPLLEAQRLVPVIDRVFPIANVAEAHQRMEANETFGKVVLTWP